MDSKRNDNPAVAQPSLARKIWDFGSTVSFPFFNERRGWLLAYPFVTGHFQQHSTKIKS
jgi:hypothetical protein